MSTLVSKKILAPGIGFFAVKNKSGRERPAEFAKTGEGQLFAIVPANFKDAVFGNADFDLIAFLESEGFHDGGGQTNRQAIAPFGYLHYTSYDIRRHCISIEMP